MEPPEKKQSSHSPFSSLPEEIRVDLLARIPRSYYPRLSLVSRRFRSILSSKELYAARSHLGTTEQCLYLCLTDGRNEFIEWFTLPDVNNKFLVQIPPSSSLSESTVGSEIYVIGGLVEDQPSSTVRVLDCRTHTWRDAPSMNIAREKASTCFYGGKIYVMGGVKVDESPFAEVFDIEAQTWECLPDPGAEVRRLDYYRIIEFEGKFWFRNPMNMSAFAYDPEQCKWELCENRPLMLWKSKCVIENVTYSFCARRGPGKCTWYDIKDRQWKEVKGLDSLDEKIMMIGEIFCVARVMSVAGKLLAVWEEYRLDTIPSDRIKNTWCAEIVVKKRDNGEIWGDVEWVDVVRTVPAPFACELLHCLAISV